MKCIKAIKPTKQIKVGTIKRVQDKDADLAVKDGYWKYIPKSEWKSKISEEKYPANVEGSEDFNKANESKTKK